MKNENEDRTNQKDEERPENKGTEEGSIFDKVMPESIKRGFETLLREGRVRSIVGDLKLPKEIVNHIMAQVDETKHSALGVISREVRLFLERTNLSDELEKLLTKISFEVSTQVRFVPNDKKQPGTDEEDSPAEEDESTRA